MRGTGLVLLVLTTAGCAAPRPTSREPASQARVDTMRGPVPMGAGDVARVERAIESAPRAVELRATTDTVRLRVGEVVASGALPLTMVDSTGELLGPLPLYDLRFGPGDAVDMAGLGIRGARVGVQSVTVSISTAFRGGRGGPAPSAVLHFVVRE